MSETSLNLHPIASWAAAANPLVGEIVGLTAEGCAVVDFPTNPGAPVVARTLVQVAPHAAQQWPPVLLAFDNGDLSSPIIVGLLHDCIVARAEPCPAPSPFQVSADGRRVTLQADHEIELRCGKASVTMRKDGKVVVKGTHIVSDGSVRNRIKGGSVAIN